MKGAECCGKKMAIATSFKYWKNDIDCDYCGGSGQEYLSDGIYGPCGCGKGYGPKEKVYFCDFCGNEKPYGKQ